MKQKIRDWLTQQFGNDEALFAELYSQYEGDMKSGIETLQMASRMVTSRRWLRRRMR